MKLTLIFFHSSGSFSSIESKRTNATPRTEVESQTQAKDTPSHLRESAKLDPEVNSQQISEAIGIRLPKSVAMDGAGRSMLRRCKAAHDQDDILDLPVGLCLLFVLSCQARQSAFPILVIENDSSIGATSPNFLI
jgi:hypothetical protein